MRLLKNVLGAAACFLAAVSCFPEKTPGTAFSDEAYVNVKTGSVTKSMLGDGVEDISSGFQLFVYFHDSGKLEGVYTIRDSDEGTVRLTAGQSLDLFVVGNLWYLDTDTGGRLSYADVLGAGFPTDSEGLGSLPPYMMGTTDASRGFRTEDFGEMSLYGIPYSGRMEAFVAVDGSSLEIPVRRMMSKVTLTIDHSGLDGGLDQGYFRNSRLHIRQCCRKLHPFMDSRAETDGDVMDTGDCDPAMTNGSRMTYVFYVPENLQGTLLDNDDPGLKTEDELISRGLGAVSGFLTYVEFCGEVDPSAGGYGGPVRYRFYLGGNNVDDFDVRRNVDYDIVLSFKAGSLFEPGWKVQAYDGLSDSRIAAFAESQSGDRLLTGRKVAVRVNRPGNVYLYFNRQGVTGENELAYLDRTEDGAYSPDNVTRSGYSVSYSRDPESLGIHVSEIVSDGMTVGFRYSVTDPRKFVPGEEIKAFVTLYPGGKQFETVIAAFGDMKVVADLSEFYVGMKRPVRLEGFAGGNVVVHASDAASSGVLRTEPDLSSAFIGGEDVSVEGGMLDLYAYRDAGEVSLVISSDDDFNDDPLECRFPVHLPRLRSENTSVFLPVDGQHVSNGVVWQDRHGGVMDRAAFDSDVYGQIMAIGARPSRDSHSDWSRLVMAGDSKIWVDMLYTIDGPAETLEGMLVDGVIGKADFVARDETLFPALTGIVLKSRFPSLVADFEYYNLTSDYLNTFGYSRIQNSLEIDMAGCLTDNVWTLTSSSSYTTHVPEKGMGVEFERKHDDDWYVRWTFDDAGADNLSGGYVDVPYGLQTFLVYIENFQDEDDGAPKYGTTYLVANRQFMLYHNVRLGLFGCFRKGSSLMQVRITYPKAAFFMKEYFEGHLSHKGYSSEVASNQIVGMTGYNNYIYYRYSVNDRFDGSGNTHMVTGTGYVQELDYYDEYDPVVYPAEVPWTETTARDYYESGWWLANLRFSLNGGVSSVPALDPARMGASDVGRWFSVSLGNTKYGYAFIE